MNYMSPGPGGASGPGGPPRMPLGKMAAPAHLTGLSPQQLVVRAPPSPRSAASPVHRRTHPSPRRVILQLFAVRDALPFAPPPKKRAPALPYTGTPTSPLRLPAFARDARPPSGSLARCLRGLVP